jgi:hypothetical protein
MIRESASLFLASREHGMPGPRLLTRKMRDVLSLSAARMSKQDCRRSRSKNDGRREAHPAGAARGA